MKQRKVSPFIYSLATLVIMLALVLVGRSFAPERVQITILSTTDLHGNLNPIDYYTNKPDNRGLAKIATLIKRVRKEQPNLVKEVAGVKIGVLGLTTRGFPTWDNPPNSAGLAFHEPLTEARKWVPILRDQ